MKPYIEYTVTVYWPSIGKRKYPFATFHTAFSMIKFIRQTDKDIKITYKSERRDFPEWLTEIFTGT